MATTTNYGWTTPDDTALVKDGASAIRTLGTSVDTTTKNLNPETTLGDIAYRSSTANTNTRLPLGTANQVLAVNSGATAPEWKTLSAIPANNGAEINTAENTTSTSYTDLTTAGPAVTVTTGTKALVIITSELSHSATGVARASFAVSGATTQAANDDYDLHSQGDLTDRFSSASYVTLTAGSNTFTMKYRVNSGTGYFSDRQIFVINMA